MSEPITLTCYSDILCIWFHVSEIRLDEVKLQFGDQVRIDYRFCSIFGDTSHKIGIGWGDRGGYEGFAHHVQTVAENFEHITLHPDLWHTLRPVSSTPAHLILKAVQRAVPDRFELAFRTLRRAFFEQGQDISQWPVLQGILQTLDIPLDTVQAVIDNGLAYADLEADQRERTNLMVQGSPTFILNNGRQKLFGNVGYRVIEANIKELLRAPDIGFASWC
jgi:predicted DsbA family dithiol-disulfide isomerase